MDVTAVEYGPSIQDKNSNSNGVCLKRVLQVLNTCKSERNNNKQSIIIYNDLKLAFFIVLKNDDKSASFFFHTA